MTNPLRLVALSRLAALLLAFSSLAVVAAAREVTLHVSAGDRDWVAAPGIVELPAELAAAESLTLTEQGSDEAILVQRVPGKPQAVWIVSDLNVGQSRTYRLAASERPMPEAQHVTCRDDGERLNIEIDGRPVLSYHHAIAPAPEGIGQVFAKSGHIHPLRTPTGRLVSDDFPPDHPHQHGVFFAWVNTTFEGRQVDFWNQARRQGAVEHIRTLETISGPVFAQFSVLLRHSDLTAPDGPKPVLEEIWTVRVYRSESPFLIDLESEQRNVADSPLIINQYHYGGMGLRGARPWLGQEESGFLTSLGKTRADGNHTLARWVIAHGTSDGGPASVIALGHPGNFRAPQPVRLHPTKPYFCFAPMVPELFEIAPGRPYRSRYRLATHDGPPDARLAEQLWHAYAEPLAVRVTATE
jgi:hypothetical protein